MVGDGDRSARLAPPSTRGVSNGAGKLLEQMARECGIKPRLARDRRDQAIAVNARGLAFRELLHSALDVQIGYASLRTILADENPERVLTDLIAQTRETGATRITRDDVRRERGMITGTAGDVVGGSYRLWETKTRFISFIGFMPWVYSYNV